MTEDPMSPRPNPHLPPILGAVVPSTDPRAPPPMPAGMQQPERRKPGRVPGKVYPKKPKVTLPLDEFDVSKLRTTPDPGHCPGCQQPSTALGLELTRELVKSSRDKLQEIDADQRGKSAELDLQYIAARLDGFCSLTCWRRTQG